MKKETVIKSSGWYEIDVDAGRTLQEVIDLTKYYWKQRSSEETWYTIDIDKFATIPDGTKKIEQGCMFYHPVDLDRVIETKLQEQKTIFLNFLWELKETMQALATNQLLVDSGEEEIVMGHGIQLSSAEMTARIANQLSGLTNFTARVKMDATLPQNPGKKCLNCGNQNGSGAIYCVGCGTKITAVNEYTIKTIKPTGYIGTQQFDQRMKRIQAKNLQQDGYVRERVTVEAEITQRQTGCSGGSTPAQPQSPPQQPPHARQVPTCPNCGKSNPPGSIFCNKCGTKLT